MSCARKAPLPRKGNATSNAALSQGVSTEANRPKTCARNTWSHLTSNSGLSWSRAAATSSPRCLRALTKLSLRQTAPQRWRRAALCAAANSCASCVPVDGAAPTSNSSSHARNEASSGTVVSRTASEARRAATARALSSSRFSTRPRTLAGSCGVAFFRGGGGGSTHLPRTVALSRRLPSRRKATAPRSPPGRSGRQLSAHAATSPCSIVIDCAPPSKRAVTFAGVRTTSTVALRFASAGQLRTSVFTASPCGCCSPKSMVAGDWKAARTSFGVDGVFGGCTRWRRTTNLPPGVAMLFVFLMRGAAAARCSYAAAVASLARC